MDCAATEAALTDYHFAQLAPPQLDDMHQHLRGCPSCALRYLELKYAVDSGAAMGVRLSAGARARLRAQVRELFPQTSWQRAQRWMARPVPRYKAAAAMVVAAALLVIAAGAVLGPRGQTGAVAANCQDTPGFQLVGRTKSRLHRGFESVDTARPMAVSLTYY